MSHSCRTRVVCVALVSLSCCTHVICVSIVLHSCCLQHECQTRATRVPHERHERDNSNTIATRVRHEQHECKTSATQVLHERHDGHTSATRMTWVQHEWKILLATIRTKTFFHTPIFTIWQVKNYKDMNNFILRSNFWECLAPMPKCVWTVHHKNWIFYGKSYIKKLYIRL